MTSLVSRFSGTIPAGYQSNIVEDQEIDKISMELNMESAHPQIIMASLEGVLVGHVDWSHHVTGFWNDELTELEKRLHAGTAVVEYKTPYGIFDAESVPDYAVVFVHQRDPFQRRPPAPVVEPVLTTVQMHRTAVELWAMEQTSFFALTRAAVEGRLSRTEDPVTSRKRVLGMVWWPFVINNLAAAQHDAWLEDDTVWPALERNIQITANQFLTNASSERWNSIASYLEANSRIYKAGVSLADTPIHVAVESAQTILAGGVSYARSLIYGDGA